MRVAMKLVVLGLISVASFGGICDDEGPQDPIIGEDLDVVLRNLDLDDNVHLFGPGESFEGGCPAASENCRVAPGGSRTVTIEDVSAGEALPFAAGRLSNIFRTRTCTWRGLPFGTPTVEFQPDQDLHCKDF